MKEDEIGEEMAKLNEFTLAEIKNALNSDLDTTTKVQAIKSHCGQFEALSASILDSKIQFPVFTS